MTGLPPEITGNSRFRRVQDDRARDAAKARAAQALYLRLTRLFVIGSTVAAIAGGLVLYGAEASPDAESPLLVRWLADGSPARIGLIVLQALGLAAAAGGGYLLGRREPGKRWIAARLRAEEGRLELARRALTIGHEAGPEAFRGAGTWFLSFIEDQLRHLDTSARRRDRASFYGLVLAALLAALGALASALTGFNSRTLVVVLAIFGVGVPALTAAVERWGEATAAGKRATLHENSLSALSALRDEAPAFNIAIDAHDLGGAMRFADRAFDILRKDHEGFSTIQGKASPPAKE